MALNDPQWGRRPEDDDRKDAGERRDDRPAGASEDDRNPRRDDRNRPEDGRDRREPNRADGRDSDDLNADIDELWNRLADMFGGRGDKSRPTNRKPGGKLLSRDDFSQGTGRGVERDDRTAGDRDRAVRGEEEGSSPVFGRRDDEEGAKSPFVFEIPRRRNSKADGGGRGNGGDGGDGGGFLDRVLRGGAATLVFGALVLWGATGFYIVPEGQAGVVTTFGKYTATTAPGFRWHIPVPIESVQLVDVSSVRTIDIGGPGRLRESLMLTDDENIVDMSFSVQYRIQPGGARDYVFNLRSPDETVKQVAESAMREVVGRRTMDSVLFESKAEIANAVRTSMQQMLNRYKSGIEVMSVAIQNAQPPEPVQAAFNDAVKAGQDRERSINLGEAYKNAILPKARGTASRVNEEALGYAARVVASATGDADRFRSLYEQYRLAPEVTRDRMYVDAVKDVLKKVTKVYVDQKNGSNLLYLPFDKLVGDVKKAAEKSAADELNIDPADLREPAPSASGASPSLSQNPFGRSSLNRNR